VTRNNHSIVARKVSIFSTLSEKHLNDMLTMAYLQSFPAHVQLIEEGDHAEFLHIIVEGSVELFCSSNNRETIMLLLRPDSTYNLSAVLENTTYTMSARTNVKTKVLMIPAENMRKMIEADAAFAHAMVTELAKRYRRLINAFREQRLYSSVTRLANYLLRANERTPGMLQIELDESRNNLASRLGMSREHLSRSFSTLRKYGVEVNGDKISLLRLNDLKQFAESTELTDSDVTVTP